MPRSHTCLCSDITWDDDANDYDYDNCEYDDDNSDYDDDVDDDEADADDDTKTDSLGSKYLKTLNEK